VQVPVFWIAQVFTNAPPGAIVVPSGIVTSAIKADASVQVAGPEGVAGLTGVPGTCVEGAPGVEVLDSGVAVEMTCVGSMTSVAVACAIFCATLRVMLASPVPSREFVARTVTTCEPTVVADQDWMTEKTCCGWPFGVGLF
jgi:hypothetical protein